MSYFYKLHFWCLLLALMSIQCYIGKYKFGQIQVFITLGPLTEDSEQHCLKTV